MTRPVVSDAAERIYAGLAAFQQGDDDTNGWVLLHLCEASARLVAKANDVLRYDQRGSGWRRMRDPDRCPAWALPWLAQHVGIPELSPGLSEAEHRSLIRHAAGFSDGTPRAITATIATTLTGTRKVRLVERVNGDAYRLAVITAPAETPTTAATAAKAREAKPTGMLLDIYVSTTPLLMEYTRSAEDVAAPIETATLADVT